MSHCVAEERKLNLNELPLLVQLNWGKDDREGRFLLKKDIDKTIPVGLICIQQLFNFSAMFVLIDFVWCIELGWIYLLTGDRFEVVMFDR